MLIRLAAVHPATCWRPPGRRQWAARLVGRGRRGIRPTQTLRQTGRKAPVARCSPKWPGCRRRSSCRLSRRCSMRRWRHDRCRWYTNVRDRPRNSTGRPSLPKTADNTPHKRPAASAPILCPDGSPYHDKGPHCRLLMVRTTKRWLPARGAVCKR